MPAPTNIQTGPDRVKPTYFAAAGKNNAKNIYTSTKTGDTIAQLESRHK